MQLTAPDTQPNFYGYAAEPKPQLVASYPTKKAALSLTRGLERDRASDETGHQIAVLGRIGSRPFNSDEMKKLYLNDEGNPWYVSDDVEGASGIKSKKLPFKPNRIWGQQPENHDVIKMLPLSEERIVPEGHGADHGEKADSHGSAHH